MKERIFIVNTAERLARLRSAIYREIKMDTVKEIEDINWMSKYSKFFIYKPPQLTWQQSNIHEYCNFLYS